MAEDGDKSKVKDSVARLLSISSLVLALCVFIALLVLAPWTLFRIRDTSDKIYEKLDAERFEELQTKVNGLEHTIMLLEAAQTKIKTEEERRPVVFPKTENTTTPNPPELGVIAKNKRSLQEDSSDFTGYGGGTVYTRWGRRTCPDTLSTSILYTGTVGVSHALSSGGGVNHQCLPLDPQFGYTKDGRQFTSDVGGSQLVGVEYRMADIYPFDNSNNRGNTLNNEDALCTVCFVKQRSVTVMIPARTECYEGWTLEYKGYLMSSRFNSQRVDYICVDEAPDAKESGRITSGSSYLFPVEVGCGALPCPNYTDGLELACVVCSR